MGLGGEYILSLRRNRSTLLTRWSQYNGEDGVRLMLDTLYNEFKRCMQLTGCNKVEDITKACLGLVQNGPLARL